MTTLGSEWIFQLYKTALAPVIHEANKVRQGTRWTKKLRATNNFEPRSFATMSRIDMAWLEIEVSGSSGLYVCVA